jgi:uncharacterized protein (DUF58 family)
MSAPAEILYRPRGRFATTRIGAHPSSEVGGFGMFRDHAPFLRWPDARRIDLRATLRDPFEATHVRRFEKRNAIHVVALVDTSASMFAHDGAPKFALACAISKAIAFSATRIGDRFRLVARGSSRHIDSAPTRSIARGVNLVSALHDLDDDDAGAEGFRAIARSLGRTRKLVFLISDLWWPPDLIEHVLASLALHDLVLLVPVDPFAEVLPNWGLMEIADSETHRKRLLFMRPSLKARWIEQEAKRRLQIADSAAGRARRPIFLQNDFDPIDLSQQLMTA